jgi:hypothetical protein
MGTGHKDSLARWRMAPHRDSAPRRARGDFRPAGENRLAQAAAGKRAAPCRELFAGWKGCAGRRSHFVGHDQHRPGKASCGRTRPARTGVFKRPCFRSPGCRSKQEVAAGCRWPAGTRRPIARPSHTGPVVGKAGGLAQEFGGPRVHCAGYFDLEWRISYGTAAP